MKGKLLCKIYPIKLNILYRLGRRCSPSKHRLRHRVFLCFGIFGLCSSSEESRTRGREKLCLSQPEPLISCAFEASHCFFLVFPIMFSSFRVFPPLQHSQHCFRFFYLIHKRKNQQKKSARVFGRTSDDVEWRESLVRRTNALWRVCESVEKLCHYVFPKSLSLFYFSAVMTAGML